MILNWIIYVTMLPPVSMLKPVTEPSFAHTITTPASRAALGFEIMLVIVLSRTYSHFTFPFFGDREKTLLDANPLVATITLTRFPSYRTYLIKMQLEHKP